MGKKRKCEIHLHDLISLDHEHQIHDKMIYLDWVQTILLLIKNICLFENNLKDAIFVFGQMKPQLFQHEKSKQQCKSRHTKGSLINNNGH